MGKRGFEPSINTELEFSFVMKNANLLTDIEGAKQLSEITGKKITYSAWRAAREKLGLAKTAGKKSKVINKKNGGMRVEPSAPVDQTNPILPTEEEKQERTC